MNSYVVGEKLTPSQGNDKLTFVSAWILCFLIPWDDMILLPWEIQFARAFTILVGGLWILSLLLGRKVRTPGSTFTWMLIFVLWSMMSILWSFDPDRTLRRSLSYVQLFTLAVSIYQCTNTFSRLISFLQAFMLGQYVLVGAVLVSYSQGNIWGDGRYTAEGVNPNDLAGTLAIGVTIACYLLMNGGKRWALVNAIFVPVGIVCVVLSGSRAGLLSVAVALLFPFLRLMRMSWKVRLTLIMAIIATVSVLLDVSESTYWRRLTTIAEQFESRDLNGRVDVWAQGLELFQRKPLAGYGAGTFPSVTGATQAARIAAHNAFLEVLVENGAVGLMLYFVVHLSLIRAVRKRSTLEKQLWGTLLVTWITINMASTWENRNITWMLWGLAVAHAAIQNPAALPQFWRVTRTPAVRVAART